MTLLEVSYQTDPYKPDLTIIEFLILASPFFITDIFLFLSLFLGSRRGAGWGGGGFKMIVKNIWKRLE